MSKSGTHRTVYFVDPPPLPSSCSLQMKSPVAAAVAEAALPAVTLEMDCSDADDGDGGCLGTAYGLRDFIYIC